MRHLVAHPSTTGRQTAFLLTALASAIMGLQAHADETPADAKELTTVVVTAQQDGGGTDYTVPVTTAATKLKLAPRDTPQSVTVITRQRMDDQDMQNLRDVLDNTTGVYSFGYDTERTVFMARGFVLSNTLIDGVPTLTRSNTDSADASLDTALYDRIEVVRGATGLLTGAGNPSAALNLVRKRADSKELTGTIEASAGSWNDYRTSADVSLPLNGSGSIRGRVVGVYQQNESYMDFYENAKNVLYATLDMDLAPGTTLTLGYDYQKTTPNGVTWGWFPLYFSDGSRANWSRSFSTAANWSYWDNTAETAFAELRHDLGNDWSLRTTFSHRETFSDAALFFMDYYDYGAGPNFPDKTTGVGPAPYSHRYRDTGRQNALDVYASGPFQLMGRQHELVLGASGSWLDKQQDEFAVTSVQPPIGSLYDWDGSYPRPTFDGGTRILGVSTKQSGLYSAVRLSLADPLKLIIGSRYSNWKTDVVDVYNGNANYSKNAAVPYAGVIFDVSKDFSVFASYTGIFTPQDYQAPNGAYLDPITGISREVGVKGEHLNGRLNTALTLFDTRQDNVAQALPGVTVGGTMNQAYEAVDGAKSRGFELEVNGQVTPAWNASMGWSYSKLEDPSGNVLNSYVPRTLVRVFSSYKLPGQLNKLTVGGGVNWQSGNSLEATCPSGICDFTQKPVTDVNLMARYQFSPKLSAQLNVNNLLDKTYYVIGEYDSVNYAPPRSATLGVKYQF